MRYTPRKSPRGKFMRSNFTNLTKNQQKKLENNAMKLVHAAHMQPYIEKLASKPVGTYVKYTPLTQREMNSRARTVVKNLLNKQAKK